MTKRVQPLPGYPLLLPLLLFVLACGDFGTGGDSLPLTELEPGLTVEPCVVDSGMCGVYWIGEGAIGGAESPPGLNPIGLPAIDSRRRVYAPASTPGVLVVWTLDGRVVDTLGRSGEGPGEMIGFPNALVGSGDTIHVRDDAGTWSVFSPELAFVRKQSGAALPPTMFLGLTPEGLMIAAYGNPLFRVIEPNGDDGVRFGSPEPTEFSPRRIVAGGLLPGRFWSVPSYRLLLSEWGVDGTSYRNLTPSNSAFPDRSTDEQGIPERGDAPTGIITHLVEDSTGLLWITASVPDPDYSPAPRATSGNESEIDRANRLRDFLIEVVDPSSGAVVASAIGDRTDTGVFGILPGPWGYRIAEDELGFWRYEFGRLVLGPRTIR